MDGKTPIISVVKIKDFSDVKKRLKSPTTLHGMPGMGMTGKTVLDHLIEVLRPDIEKICEVYSTAFPSNVFIQEDGLMLPPKIEIYAYIDDREGGNDLVLITGDMQPSSVIGTNNLSYHIAKILHELGVKELISLAATPVNAPKASPNVYITVTNSDLIEAFKKNGVKGPFIRGVITGMNGIIPSLAKFEFDIDGCALLAETFPHYGKDINASISLINILTKYLKIKIPIVDLEEKAKKVEDLYNSLLSQQKRRESRKRKSKKDLGYIS
ncbi:MAG: PAC2 family protein [Candidatus Helarchaeota archaeon]